MDAMERALMLDPDDIRAHPELAESVVSLLQEAADAGEVVSISTKLKTLTPAEVAHRLNMSRPTVSRRIAEGALHTIKVGNRHRITIREFERFRDAIHTQMVSLTAAEIEAELDGD